MKLILQRYSDNGNSTLGLLFQVISQDLVLEAYTLEDESREEKVKGETCIPSGLYEIKKRVNVSPLTLKYRKKYHWFDYHLQLQDVYGFEYVYIHVGNTEKHTDGCILLGSTANLNTQEKGFIAASSTAFRRMYEEIGSELTNGNKVFIEVKDVMDIL